MIPELCLSARELLNWSQHDLALRAKCSLQTIKNVEKGRYQASATTRSALLLAFEAAGLEFTDGDAPDVRFRNKGNDAEVAPSSLCMTRSRVAQVIWELSAAQRCAVLWMPSDGQPCPVFNIRPRPKSNVLHRLLNVDLVEYDPDTNGTLWRLTQLGIQVCAELARQGRQPLETYSPPRPKRG